MNITFYTLMNALKTGGPLLTPSCQLSIVNRVEREDGSGHCFNVTGHNLQNETVTVFVRTID